jgi:hypothetical protein
VAWPLSARNNASPPRQELGCLAASLLPRPLPAQGQPGNIEEQSSLQQQYSQSNAEKFESPFIAFRPAKIRQSWIAVDAK